jgi:urease accessory protein
MRAVYHLANRHVPLEITINYIALERDPVLENLLKQMGLELEYLEVPFFPEQGAYHQH